MTIDFWGLGLQAINVLILVWLLGRVFWRPVAGAISRRQDAVRAMLDAASAAQDKADAALAELTDARAQIAAERDSMLAAAKVTAEAATKAALAEAQIKAEALRAAAQTAIERDTAAAHKANAVQAAALAVEIANKLLVRLNTPMVQTAFLAPLVEAIVRMSASERADLVASSADMEIVTATALNDESAAKIESAVRDALGGDPGLRFVTDPDLIAGLELRSPHFVLHNSWRADLDKIQQELEDAT